MSQSSNSNNENIKNENENNNTMFEYIPTQTNHSYLNIICGKLINTSQTNDGNEQLSLKQLQKTKENHTIAISRKIRSDIKQRNTTLYLYFLLLAIDPTTQITLSRNARDPENNPSLFKTYRCESIISRGVFIYQRDVHYCLRFDSIHDCNTVDIDEVTNCPKIDISNTLIYSREQINRIQQHILIQIINKQLKENGNEMKYYVTKSKQTSFLSSIQFDEYYDMNEECKLEENKRKNRINSKDNQNNKFEELMDSIFDIFSYFIDRSTGITKQIIIGDFDIDTNDYRLNKECCFIGRWKFFQTIHEVRNKNTSIEKIFSTIKKK